MDVLVDIEPEVWTSCPVCGRRFEQTAGPGRKRVYCSRACQAKQFRHTKSVTKLSNKARSDLIKQALSHGDWRCHKLPVWPHYHCLACGEEIGSADERDEIRGMVGPAWYDWNDFDSAKGTYRRVICETCYA